MRKKYKKNEIARYKTRFVTQGFSQRPCIDFDKTYTLMIDIITFRYLISLIVLKGLDMCLMDLVIAYLYRILDVEIYIKLPNEFKLPKTKRVNL